MVNLKAYLKDKLTIDLRILSLLRIFLGLILIWNIAERFHFVEPFYTDNGIVPAFLAKEATVFPWMYSFYHLSQNSEVQIIWLTLEFISAFCLVLGLKTRFAVIFSWIFLCSAQTRNPLVLFGGDDVLRLVLFWLMFLPLDRFYSFEKKISSKTLTPDSPYFYSVANIGLILQVLLIYFFSGVFKFNSYWLHGDTLFYVFSGSHLIKPLGHTLLTLLPNWMIQLTGFSILATELLLPLIFLLSPKKSWLSLLFPGFFLFFHLMTALTMRVEFFPYITISALLIFFSGFFQNASAPTIEHHLSKRQTIFLQTIIATLLLVNLNTVFFFGQRNGIQKMAEVLQIQQEWTMFSRPFTWDAQIFAEAQKKDGTKIDLVHNRELSSYETQHPEDFEKYGYERWLRLIGSLTLLKKPIFDSSYLGQWFCKKHEQDQITQIDFKAQIWTLTPTPTQAARNYTTQDLGSHTCH